MGFIIILLYMYTVCFDYVPSIALPFPITHPLSPLMLLKIDSGMKENTVFVFLSLAYFT